MGEHREREQLREAQIKQQQANQERQVQQVVAQTQKDYAAVRELIENPAAWKALLALRAKLRRLRTGWLSQQLDPKKTHSEKDILVGQYNAVLLAFEMVEHIKEIHTNMVPGKEADYIRERLFRNPSAQQQQ